jgi:hypothetical protein
VGNYGFLSENFLIKIPLDRQFLRNTLGGWGLSKLCGMATDVNVKMENKI